MKRLTTKDESGFYHLRRGPKGGEINKITVVQHLGRLEDVALQPTLTPPTEWVSVEESLPEPTYCVLVYTTDHSVEVDARGGDGEWMMYEVTHWMPLPAPPDRRPPEGEA